VRDPANSDAEARRRYLGYLQQSLGCVTASAVWRPGEGATADEWLALTEPRTILLRRGGADPLYFRATQTFHYDDHLDFPGERKVVTDEYAYTLGEDAEFGTELLAWHWQPSHGHPDPHLHVGASHPTEKRFSKWHIPGGRVAFEQVLLFAIDELGVETVGPVDDARDMLNGVLARFRKFASWGVDRR
jgi:hypothetical protein